MDSRLQPTSFKSLLIQKQGLLLVDKPSGPTSHDVVAWARRVFGERRIGHTGTLDPLATGLLLVLVSREFTRLQTQLLSLPKTYLVEILLGATSDTYDRLGQISAKSLMKPKDLPTIQLILEEFKGNIQQQVPAYSAVKIGGKKLYSLARQQKMEAVELPVRSITIDLLEIVSFEWPKLTLRIGCSSGTYIRSLAHDLGEKLGCGGLVQELRRETIGPFSVTAAEICPYLPFKTLSSTSKD